MDSKRKEAIAAYLFMAPNLIGLLIFLIGPMLYAFYVSLHHWDIITEMRWAGYENYVNVFHDMAWWKSLWKTLIYTAVFVPCLYVLSLSLALIVHGIPRFTGTFRTVFFLPVIISPAISGVIWKYLMEDKVGLLNQILGTFGIGGVPWLTDTHWALYSMILVGIWLVMGFYMIIFLAGLQDIPKEYYEAATIDGANYWRSFWHITLPNLRHTSVFVIVMTIIGSFQVFDQIKVMTNGGPVDATKLSVVYIFETSFTLYNMGYASALSFCLFIIIILITLIQIKMLRNDEA